MSKLVCICAGHDLVHTGVHVGNFREEVMATKLRDRIYKSLVDMQVPVIRDGQEGQNYPLREAIRLANKADIAVDLHFNASTNPLSHGIEALCHENHKLLAQDLCKAIQLATGFSLRGDLGWKPANAGHHSKLGFCEVGGIVLEICFMTNEVELKGYISNKFDVADNIARVLHDWSFK